MAQTVLPHSCSTADKAASSAYLWLSERRKIGGCTNMSAPRISQIMTVTYRIYSTSAAIILSNLSGIRALLLPSPPLGSPSGVRSLLRPSDKPNAVPKPPPAEILALCPICPLIKLRFYVVSRRTRQLFTKVWRFRVKKKCQWV